MNIILAKTFYSNVDLDTQTGSHNPYISIQSKTDFDQYMFEQHSKGKGKVHPRTGRKHPEGE
jgi:hypothetical protein